MAANSFLRFGKRVLGRPAAVPAVPPRHMPDGREPNPPHPEVLPAFRLFAVVKAWMEEDVIEATVKNAQAQGVESVFVVDNGSTDATIERAEAAGAIVAEVYRTEIFDEALSQTLVNAVVARESTRCGAEYVWWLYLDCDEFPEGPDGLSVREYLASLDARFRIVGARFMNHLPFEKPEYVPGFHPIDFQPHFYEFAGWWDPPCGHWKHPLQRFDRQAPFIRCEGGAHHGVGGERGRRSEPVGGIVMHHFQYRDEEFTRNKLQLFCGPASTRASWLRLRNLSGFDVRYRSLDAVYNRRWDEIERPRAGTLKAAEVRTWPHVERVRRWYPREDVDAFRHAPSVDG